MKKSRGRTYSISFKTEKKRSFPRNNGLKNKDKKFQEQEHFETQLCGIDTLIMYVSKSDVQNNTVVQHTNLPDQTSTIRGTAIAISRKINGCPV